MNKREIAATRRVFCNASRTLREHRRRYQLRAFKRCRHATRADLERIAERMRSIGLYAPTTFTQDIVRTLVRVWFAAFERPRLQHQWVQREHERRAWVAFCERVGYTRRQESAAMRGQ